MSPNLNIAISNRRKKLKKVYASKEWKKSVKEFIDGKSCEWCGKKQGELNTKGKTVSLLAHHPYLESYKDGTYSNLYLSGCMVLCNSCHFALHKGLVLCKRCRQHYHNVGADVCRSCFLELHPEIVEAREKKAEEVKALRKKINDEQKARVKKWKKENPLRGKK